MIETIADIIETLSTGSQADMAKHLDVPASTLNDWMRRISTPRDRDIKQIVQMLGLPEAYAALRQNISTTGDRTAAADALILAYHERLSRSERCTKKAFRINTTMERKRLDAAVQHILGSKHA